MSDSSSTMSTSNNNNVRNNMIRSNARFCEHPNESHECEDYQDMESEFCPALYSSLEKYLPSDMLNASREDKKSYMDRVLDTYADNLFTVRSRREHRQKIFLNYQPLHKELYTLNPANFFVPSFLKAITENTEESIRSIISEPSPGLYTFDMLHPHFCSMMLAEVGNYEEHVKEGKFDTMRPNTMNKYGVILNDCGFEPMLTQLMYDFIRPISKVLFPEVGGAAIDSQHGFIVEYGKYRDTDLGLHVDDSEVTLNVCLGSQFSGGELYFQGVRCDKHLNSESKAEENIDYFHVPGQALLHHGHHRHGAKPTTSGYRVNLLLWCKSSVYRELRKYQRDFSDWCGECSRERKQRQRQCIAATIQRLRVLPRVDAKN